MTRRQRDHRKLTEIEMKSKELNRSVLSSFNMDFRKTASRKFLKMFRSSNKVMRYYDFMKKNRRRAEC